MKKKSEKIPNKTVIEDSIKQKRIINIRPLFVFFISIMFGIFFMYSLRNAIWEGTCNFGVVLCSVYFVAIFIVGILSLITSQSKKHNNRFLNSIKFLSKYRTAIIGGFIFCVIGVSIFLISFARYDNLPDFDGEIADVSARISDNGEEAGSTTAYELSNITVTVDGTEYELNSGARLYLYGEYYLEMGDLVTFSAEINSADIKDGYGLFVNSNAYTFYDTEDIEVTGNKLYFNEVVRQKIFGLLSDNMNSQNAGIAYSVLFGDKSNIDTDIRNSFSYSGIAHILAVSGLHVGFLVLLLSFILKKCKVNKYVNFCLIGSILLVYCYLCGFTPSVVRASVMSIILLFAILLGVEYDILSSLSLAGLLILLVNPFDLFQVGFQLSFASVFGIITLMPPISRFLRKKHCPKWLGDSLAITISTNVAVVLISLNYFNQFALLGILTNLIVLPVFSIAYSLLFVISFVGIGLSFMETLLVVPDLMLHFIKLMAGWVSSIPYSVITVFKVGFIAIVVLFVAMYIAHFLMVNKWLKQAVVGLLITVIGVTLVVINIPAKFDKNQIYLTYQSSTNYALFVNDKNEKMLVGLGSQDDNYLDSFLTSLKIDKLDALIVYEVTLRDVEYINQLIEEYDIETVFFASSDEDVNSILIEDVLCKNVGFILQNDSTEICGYSLYAYYYYGKATGVVVTDGETDTLLLKNKATWNALRNVAEWWGDTFENVVVNKSYVENMDEVLYADHIYSYGHSTIDSEIKVDIGYKRNFTLTL